jgi:prepilin-type processing-associated H-X9-DG protein/prepilin-type N-terminal cleavage/methylation domain-containing protein
MSPKGRKGFSRATVTVAAGWNSCFTLIELLTVIAVIGLIASLLLSALQRSKAKAKSIQCLNQLRQLGLATLMYGDDNRGQLVLQFPLDPDKTWASALHTNQSLLPLTLFLCPSYPPKIFQDWRRTYGVRLDPPEGCSAGELDEFLRIEQVTKPDTYLHLADTTSRGRANLKAQQYYYFRVISENEVHLRHLGRANGFFLDGHVETTGRKRLEDLGIRPLDGLDVIPAYF